MNSLKRVGLAAAAAASLTLLTGAEGGGCGQGLDNRRGESGIDVGGPRGAQWQVRYGTTLEVTVRGGAGIISRQSYPMGAGGTFTVDGVQVDLAQLCRRGDVVCPQDVFPSEVTMTQPGSDRHLLYVTFAPKGPLAQLGQQTLLGNVDSDDDFAIALGVGGAGHGACGLLGISYVTGRIQADPNNSERGVSLSGDIVTAYAGACAAAGQGSGAAAGLTVELRLPLSATRRN